MQITAWLRKDFCTDGNITCFTFTKGSDHLMMRSRLAEIGLMLQTCGLFYLFLVQMLDHINLKKKSLVVSIAYGP